MPKRTLFLACSLVAIVLFTVVSVSPDVGAASGCRHRRCRTADSERRHDPVITAAGDVAEPDPSDATEATARMVRQIDPTVALTLGDNQYPQGELSDFRRGYDSTWGTFLSKTRPTLGNHEYERSSSAAGYFDYFGRRVPNEWYSFNLGGWHLISLDSSCDMVGGCDHGSQQYLWLRHDLATHHATCTLAYWHHPRWSSGTETGNSPEMGPFMRLLYRARADVVLSGHEHNYERFAPQTPAGTRDPNGIVEFVVGTGGRSLLPIGSADDNSLVRNDESYGVLRMVLHPRSYDFAFHSVLGSTFRDAGSRSCQ
jgi:hypothetical protein